MKRIAFTRPVATRPNPSCGRNTLARTGLGLILILSFGCQARRPAAATATTANNGDFTLALGGKAQAAIVIASDPSPAVEFAASELRHFIRQMSGADVKIVKDTQAVRSPCIYLGKSRFTEKLRTEIYAAIDRDWQGLHARIRKEESFFVFTENNDLYLVGGEDRGSLYAVYELLEKLGCRWFMPGKMGEVVPSKPTLTVGLTKNLVQPGFIKRGGVSGYTPSEAGQTKEWMAEVNLWAVRNRFNQNILDRSRKDRLSAAERKAAAAADPYAWNINPPDPRYGGAFISGGTGHAYNPLMGKYFKEHPEYFGLRGGERSGHNWLCTSNPDVIRIIREKFANYIRQYPFVDEFTLDADDNSNYCTCDACMKIGEKSFTDRAVKLLNEVAEVSPEGTLFTLLAYGPHRDVPVNYVPAENVNVQITYWYTLACNPWMPITSEANGKFKAAVDGWLKTAKNVTMRPYWGHYSYFIPFPVADVMRADIPHLYKHNRIVNGWYVETHTHWATQGLQIYLMGRLFWDPAADVEGLLNDYYEAFYGKATAPFMKEYHRLLEAEARRFGAERGASELFKGATKFFTDDVIARADALIGQAGAAVRKNGTPEQRRRFEFVEKGWHWSVQIVKALAKMQTFERNLKDDAKAFRAKNDTSLLDEAEKTFRDFETYANTPEGKIAFEPCIISNRSFGLPKAFNLIENLKLNILAIRPGTHDYVDVMERGGMTRFDALEIKGFKPGRWGFYLDEGQEGQITHLFKAAGGGTFRSFKFSPYLMTAFKKGDDSGPVEPFGKAFYNKVELSKDGKTYETLYENVNRTSSSPFWDVSKKASGLKAVYIRISAGFPNRNTLIYASLKAAFTVSPNDAR